MSAPAMAAAAIVRQARDISRCMRRRDEYGERPGLRPAWRDWHRRNARPRDRRPCLLGSFFRRQRGIPMDAEKPPTGDFRGRIGDKP